MEHVAGHITNYGKAGEMKKLSLMVIAHKSSTDDIMKLRKVFDQYDASNDGEICVVFCCKVFVVVLAVIFCLSWHVACLNCT
jgi:hypothetical protein